MRTASTKRTSTTNASPKAKKLINALLDKADIHSMMGSYPPADWPDIIDDYCAALTALQNYIARLEQENAK